MATTRKSKKNISARMMSYFIRHPNETVTLEMISRALSLTEQQVKNNMNAFRYAHRNDKDHISQKIMTVMPGSAWRYEIDEVSTEPSSTPSNNDAPESPLSSQPADTSPKNAVVNSSSVPTGYDNQKKMFKEVGPVTDGFVIQDKDDVLYRATRL